MSFLGWFPAVRRALGLSLLGLVCACSTSPNATPERALPQPVNERACSIEPSNASASDPNATDAGTIADAATGTVTKYLDTIGCLSDFDTLASLPLDVTIPGVRSMKFVIDTQDLTQPDFTRLYFQNSKLYQIHYDFVRANLKNFGSLDNFSINYYGQKDERRFLLGSISHYEDLDIWALELAAYDTATPAIIEKIFDTISTLKAYFRPGLAFHPTSTALEAVVGRLDPAIPVVLSDEIYAKTEFQPLVRGTCEGILTFLTAKEVQSGAYIPYYSIVVLDEPPNSISVTQGIITEVFQASLSHLNVLATNRGTPNMGLRGARNNPTLLKYKDQWVKFTVTNNDWSIEGVTAEEGAAYYEAHKPAQVTLPPADLSVTEILDAEAVVPNYIALNNDSNTTQADVIAPINRALKGYGGKTTNYSILAQAGLPTLKAFGIPIYYYDKFMRDNGFYDVVDGFLRDESFNNDAHVREIKLQQLRNAMMSGVIDPGLQDELKARLARDFTGTDGKPLVMRFRTSTNSEDLAGFPCSGCYNSQKGDPADWEDVLIAIRAAYSTAWLFRTFEERNYYRVDQKSLGMGLLVHAHFPSTSDTANGVAVTTNPYDANQVDAEAYYINVEYGGSASVVALPTGVTTDEFLYFVGANRTPTVYLAHSNVLPAGTKTVLSLSQIADLAGALTSIKNVFRKAYTEPAGWYAMVIELKFSALDVVGNPTKEPLLWIKEARPYPNPNR